MKINKTNLTESLKVRFRKGNTIPLTAKSCFFMELCSSFMTPSYR